MAQDLVRADETVAHMKELAQKEALRPKVAGHLMWMAAKFEIGKAEMHVNQFVAKAHNVTFSDDMIEFLNNDLDRLEDSIKLARAALGGGNANINWDEELAKLQARSDPETKE
jgi:hypothetical protein